MTSPVYKYATRDDQKIEKKNNKKQNRNEFFKKGLYQRKVMFLFMGLCVVARKENYKRKSLL